MMEWKNIVALLGAITAPYASVELYAGNWERGISAAILAVTELLIAIFLAIVDNKKAIP